LPVRSSPSCGLPRQFDEYIWFDETRAVQPLTAVARPQQSEIPDTYPFGL
jgi:hypothetical protein